MIHPTEDIRHFLHSGVRVHMAGIGGVSMCALAEVLKGMGVEVQGSDMTDSDSVKHLRAKGIPVAIGHNAENLGDCDFVTAGMYRSGAWNRLVLNAPHVVWGHTGDFRLQEDVRVTCDNLVLQERTPRFPTEPGTRCCCRHPTKPGSLPKTPP